MQDTLIDLVKESNQVYEKEYDLSYFGIFSNIEDYCLEVLIRENISIAPELRHCISWERVAEQMIEKGYIYEIADIHLRRAGETEKRLIGYKRTKKTRIESMIY